VGLAAGAAAAPAAATGAPHSPQNLAAGPSGDPQTAQAALSPFPHCSQNFKPGGLLLPQLEQTAIEESPPGEAGTGDPAEGPAARKRREVSPRLL
jgi:hypothetical protein